MIHIPVKMACFAMLRIVPLGDPAAMNALKPGNCYDGFATAITPVSITIRSPGWWVQRCTHSLDGEPIMIVRVTVPPQEPRTFAFSTGLASGHYSNARGDSYAYRVKDVQVGDRVSVVLAQAGDVDHVTLLSILRRPGGRVPPSPAFAPDNPHPHHERMNAQQDLEEKGIPLPDRFASFEERAAREARKAPPPREAVPQIPPANP